MEETKQGAFLDSLKRNNKQIRDDRAKSIAEDAQVLYRREVEDIDLKISRLKRDQENMLDLSPDNAHSLKLASDFDGKDYVAKDLKIGIDIRNLEIALEIAKARYEYLFGAK
jgi:hypothetical protein